VWTIGWGHTGKNVFPGDKITLEVAQSLFDFDLKNAQDPVDALGVQLTQGQYDALVSFCFNLGADKFSKSTLRKMVLTNAINPAIRKQFDRWVYSNGVVLPGLVRRRKEEADLYFS